MAPGAGQDPICKFAKKEQTQFALNILLRPNLDNDPLLRVLDTAGQIALKFYMSLENSQIGI